MELNNKRIDVAKLRKDSLIERQSLEEKVRKAENKNLAISTTRGFENYVRTTYPVVKEGEGVIVIYDEEKSPVSLVREDMNIWERLLILFHRFVK